MGRRRLYVFLVIIFVGIIIGFFCLPDSGREQQAETDTGSAAETGAVGDTDDGTHVGIAPGDLAAAAEKRSHELLDRAARATDAVSLRDGLIKAFEADPTGPWGGEAAAQLGHLWNRSGNPAKARKWYQTARNAALSKDTLKRVSTELASFNRAEAAPAAVQVNMLTYKVRPGDSLWKIARRYSTTIGAIRKVNKLRNDMIRVDTTLKVPKGPFDVRVSRRTHRLQLLQDGKTVKVYLVGLGAPDSPTPTGTWTVQNKLVNPVWYSPHGPIPHNDSRNVLGSRWMGFNGRLGIHGTRKQDEHTIGQDVSNGCIRLRDADVQELYNFLVEGKSKVTIVD